MQGLTCMAFNRASVLARTTDWLSTAACCPLPLSGKCPPCRMVLCREAKSSWMAACVFCTSATCTSRVSGQEVSSILVLQCVQAKASGCHHAARLACSSAVVNTEHLLAMIGAHNPIIHASQSAWDQEALERRSCCKPVMLSGRVGQAFHACSGCHLPLQSCPRAKQTPVAKCEEHQGKMQAPPAFGCLGFGSAFVIYESCLNLLRLSRGLPAMDAASG